MGNEKMISSNKKAISVETMKLILIIIIVLIGIAWIFGMGYDFFSFLTP